MTFVVAIAITVVTGNAMVFVTANIATITIVAMMIVIVTSGIDVGARRRWCAVELVRRILPEGRNRFCPPRGAARRLWMTGHRTGPFAR